MSLPIELIKIILNQLSILDKRNLIRCCKYFYKLFYLIENDEIEFIKLLNTTKFLSDKPIKFHRYEMYILEYIYYDREDMLENYLKYDMRIFRKYPLLYFNLATRNQINICQKLYQKYGKHLKQIIEGSAVSGNLEMVKWTYRKMQILSLDKVYMSGTNKDFSISNLCSLAAENGHLEILKWAQKNGCPFDLLEFSTAAKNGHLEILIWAYETGYWCCSNIDCYAAENGHLVILKWRHKIGRLNIGNSYLYAAKNGHIEILKWMHENAYSSRLPWDWHLGTYASMCFDVIKNGQIDILKWLQQNKYNVYHHYFCNIAAEYDRLEILQWAQKNGCEWTEAVCANAADGGHLKVLKWARENGCPWNAKTCRNAAAKGHLELLIWAIENGCDYDNDDMFYYAIKNNHFEIFKFLCKCKYQPRDNFYFCGFAAANNNLEMLKLARENGYVWSPDTCCNAANNNNFEIIKWARENGCPWGSIDNFYLSITTKNYEMVKWIKENGGPINYYMCNTVSENRDLEMLKWARENGFPWESRVCLNAIKNGYLKMLKWAHEMGCPRFPKTCSYAAYYGHLKILKWAYKNEYKINFRRLIEMKLKKKIHTWLIATAKINGII